MKHSLKLIISVAVTALVLASCSNSAKSEAPLFDGEMNQMNNPAPVAKMKAEFGVEQQQDAFSVNANSSYTEQDRKTKKLIHQASIDIETKNLAKSEMSLVERVNALGGYVDSNSTEKSSAWFTVRIPEDKLDEFLGSIGDLGLLIRKSLSVTDVTRQFVDLDSRIASKKVLKERLESYLKQAKNITDLLEIEKSLNEVTSDLESIETQMRTLSNEIDFATINMSFSLPPSPISDDFPPSIGEGFAAFGRFIIGFFYNLFFFLLGFFIIALPLGLIAFVVWKFLFSKKSGFVRKMFTKKE